MNFIKKDNLFDYKVYENLIQKILKKQIVIIECLFRENFAFILGMSYFCLIENSKNWTLKKINL